MKTLENIEKHLKELKKNDWDRLFSLIPIIEATKEFSTGGDIIEDKNDPEKVTVTHEFEADIVTEFRTIMYDLDLIIYFDSYRWDKAKKLHEINDFSGLDTVTLLKILTIFIRADHLSYGSGLADRFRDGSVGNILKEIKKNVSGV